jgi:periplasmic copper chaperone A
VPAKLKVEHESLPIPADTTVELNADQPHILLVGLTEPLDGYQYFPLMLTFERAGQMEIDVYVEEPNLIGTARFGACLRLELAR